MPMPEGSKKEIIEAIPAAAFLLAIWLALVFWPKPGPCVQARTLRQDIEKKLQQRRVDALEDKKDQLDEKLDDEVYRLQVSPEEYRRYQEALQKDESLKRLAETAARFDAEQRAQLDREIKEASDLDAACKEKSSPR